MIRFILADPVEIGFLRSIEAAVKTRSGNGNGSDTDVIRQILVQIITNLVRRLIGFQPELRDLSPGVNACVCAACPVDIHR